MPMIAHQFGTSAHPVVLVFVSGTVVLRFIFTPAHSTDTGTSQPLQQLF